MADEGGTTYVLFARGEQARDAGARAWCALAGFQGGTDLAAAAAAGRVILAGAPDFFPAVPLPAHVVVHRIVPLPGSGADDCEQAFGALLAGKPLVLPEETDARAVLPAPVQPEWHDHDGGAQPAPEAVPAPSGEAPVEAPVLAPVVLGL